MIRKRGWTAAPATVRNRRRRSPDLTRIYSMIRGSVPIDNRWQPPLPADHEPEPCRHAAKILFVGVLREPAFSENPRNVGVLRVDRHADPSVHANLDAGIG